MSVRYQRRLLLMKNVYKWKKCIRGSNDWWSIKNHGWRCESLIFKKKKEMKYNLGNIRTLNVKKTKIKKLKRKRKYKNEKSDYYFIISLLFFLQKILARKLLIWNNLQVLNEKKVKE